MDEYSALYEDPDQALRDYPSIAELYLSRDRHAALFQVTPADGLSVNDISRLARELAAHAPPGPFTVAVGGTPAEHNDFNDYMFRSLPRIFGFVVGATLVLLFAAFRSYLLPVSAVLMNLLAVCTGIGAVVAVFQFGCFASSRNTSRIATTSGPSPRGSPPSPRSLPVPASSWWWYSGLSWAPSCRCSK
jgi:uncharacterized membrane protein YdfJ with MMPL/SSD domain